MYLVGYVLLYHKALVRVKESNVLIADMIEAWCLRKARYDFCFDEELPSSVSRSANVRNRDMTWCRHFRWVRENIDNSRFVSPWWLPPIYLPLSLQKNSCWYSLAIPLASFSLNYMSKAIKRWGSCSITRLLICSALCVLPCTLWHC